MRTYADVCGRMLTYADVYGRMLTSGLLRHACGALELVDLHRYTVGEGEGDLTAEPEPEPEAAEAEAGLASGQTVHAAKAQHAASGAQHAPSACAPASLEQVEEGGGRGGSRSEGEGWGGGAGGGLEEWVEDAGEEEEERSMRRGVWQLRKLKRLRGRCVWRLPASVNVTCLSPTAPLLPPSASELRWMHLGGAVNRVKGSAPQRSHVCSRMLTYAGVC
jgi:hypothetical protein